MNSNDESTSTDTVRENDRQYRRTLTSILPPYMLTRDGYLRTPTGTSEVIRFYGPARSARYVNDYEPRPESHEGHRPPMLDVADETQASRAARERACYKGGLPIKLIRHRLEKSKQSLSVDEYEALRRFVAIQLEAIGTSDIISTANARHAGVLVHETFHDVQSYLCDYFPEIFDSLFVAVESQWHSISEWWSDPGNAAWTGPEQYRLEHFFPTQMTCSPYGTDTISDAIKFMRAMTQKLISLNAGKILGDALNDLGRCEAIPVLLSAAAVGNLGAARVLGEIFTTSGLNAHFYQTLPQYREP